MKKSISKSNWNLVVELWNEHLTNPKFGHDFSVITIFDQENPNNQIEVSHSFILKNQKKLMIINKNLHCRFDGKEMEIYEFSSSTLSKKYHLPNRPQTFSQKIDNQIINANHAQKEITQKDENQEDNIIELIPFGSKNSEKRKLALNKPFQNIKNYKKYFQIAAIILPLIIITGIIIQVTSKTDFTGEKITQSPQDKNESENINDRNESRGSSKKISPKTSSNLRKNQSSKTRTFSSVKNNVPKKTAPKKLEMRNHKRKPLMNTRKRKTPSSINNDDAENYQDTKDTSTDNYDQITNEEVTEKNHEEENYPPVDEQEAPAPKEIIDTDLPNEIVEEQPKDESYNDNVEENYY